ncbi:protein starmaker-like, partial [Maniola hyperantus]|uniref:protein starmaker-like n=1 Tax=Aphantopus hyperantus TaxID=2795564 RepID=UPI003749A8FB
FQFIVWIVCGSAFSSDEEHDAYFKSLGFNSYFDDQDSGVASLASNQYPQLFDTVVSSSNNFGSNPIASESFFPYGRPAKLVAHQQPQQSNLNIAPNTQQLSPLRYDIRTIHDPNYKVYKAEENEEKNNLAPLKKNPTDAVYFQPYINVEVKHPLEYRKEDLNENFEGEQKYKQNPYIAGSARFRRYTGGRSRENLKKAEDDEEDDPYNYKAEYISRPKAFDEGPYSSPYKKKKGSKDEYEYPYSYDSGYDHKEYERIKELSEKQAAEIKQNPGNCHEVKKDGMSCMTCKDPKTGGNYESCSYVAEPKNNKYAYSKERKYDSNDDADEPEQKSDSPKKSEKHHSKKDDTTSQKFTSAENEKPYSSYKQGDDSDSANGKYKYGAPQKYTAENQKPYSNYKQADNSDSPNDKYKSYYTHSTQPKKSEALRAASSEESSEEVTPKPYNYKTALPGFYTDNEPKKDVENVLAEFKKKDRSACNKVTKNGMTCYQCLDKNGLKNEECMFVSESAPKQSHLAYQEHKEFTSKPATLNGGNEGAESQTVTTNSPPAQKSAAYAASTNYSKKLKRKKAPQTTITEAATNPAAKTTQKVKRSEGSKSQEYEGTPVDVSNIAPPEEFAGVDSKGAFWAETLPRYSAALGVSLPEFMLSRSEHEASFDEAVAGA